MDGTTHRVYVGARVSLSIMADWERRGSQPPVLRTFSMHAVEDPFLLSFSVSVSIDSTNSTDSKM